MPRTAKESKHAKAKKLSKTVLESNCNYAEAGRRLGISKQAVAKAMKRPIFRKTFHELLEKDIPDKVLVKKLKQLLEAQKPISCNVYLRNKDGEVVQMKDAGGCTKDFVDIPDNNVQLKAAEFIAKAKGHVRSDGAGGGSIIYNIVYGNNRSATSSLRNKQE